MKPHIISTIPANVLMLLGKIQNILDALPDPGTYLDARGRVRLIACHEMSCALAILFSHALKRHTGTIGLQSHSWLITLDEAWIIDPYPIACMNTPLLLSTKFPSPWASIYKQGPDPWFMSGPTFHEIVTRVQRSMEELHVP